MRDSMRNSPLNPSAWQQEINTLKQQGFILCPVMLNWPNRYQASQCTCDRVPARTAFLRGATSCHHNKETCLVNPKVISQAA